VRAPNHGFVNGQTGTITVQPCGISPNGSSAIVWLPNHGFAVGNHVLITGADQGYYNGDFVIAAVTVNTLTITVTASAVASGSS